MKFVNFYKFKKYLESRGYVQDSNAIDYDSPIWLRNIFFSKEGETDKYRICCFCKINKKPLEISGNVSSIHFGHGTWYSGNWETLKIDMRKNFWKQFIINN